MPEFINSIYKGSRGKLWVGTLGQGLFDPDKNAFRYYSTSDGLISNSIMSIIEDDDGYIWVGTSVGISRIDPQTDAVMNLEKEDGLLFSSFQKRAIHKNRNGTIALGGRNGLVLFDPRDFGQTLPAAKVTINDFKLFNQSVAQSRAERPTVLQKPK
jgi:ligand-binding sensor domain-containing protein